MSEAEHGAKAVDDEYVCSTPSSQVSDDFDDSILDMEEIQQFFDPPKSLEKKTPHLRNYAGREDGHGPRESLIKLMTGQQQSDELPTQPLTLSPSLDQHLPLIF